MNYQKILEEISPIPVNLPKIYFLGDTGAGKTTIIRKIMGTDDFNFPTTRQTRTTVAVTEYVISKSLPFRATLLFKSEEQIRGYVREILLEATYKAYKGSQPNKNRISKYLKQTTDQRFRLYYIIHEDILLDIAEQIVSLFSRIEERIKDLQTEFPEDSEETETFLELSLEDLREDFDIIENDVFNQIKEKVAEACNSYDLCSEFLYYQFSNQEKREFVSKCKSVLSSEKGSISPVIDYARIQGDLLADWIGEDTEIVLIDGEGIGHDTKEASQLAPRHYEHFYRSDAIVLVEESKKPFVASGKSALKSIFERGYGEKLLIVFSKLDEVMPYDVDDPSREDKIDEVNHSLENVLSALKNERVELSLNDENLFYFSAVSETELDNDTIDEFTSVMGRASELFSFETTFIKPEYDFEMLSGYLRESTEQFIKLYQGLLGRQHWQTVKAFNRRMCWGVDGFRMFTPIADFEEKINDEVKSFISNPKGWSAEVTGKLKSESIDQIKREFNQLILAFGRETIMKIPAIDWSEALSYYGTGSTFARRSKIKKIFKGAIPLNIATEQAMKFKDEIKRLVIRAIENCENEA
ncbi:conserved hypothetical protein [Candidatus Desulfarcum epimagneticum]|uniref:Uncharacterized protein n=1 Tax=uncultured Desulfobacteraceae bacterium TaxID=218296 RepID=A0A484HDY7_9BACT|nr:conserved hypothetical protein [uncultured Desulfobacteraceae bacterium]